MEIWVLPILWVVPANPEEFQACKKTAQQLLLHSCKVSRSYLLLSLVSGIRIAPGLARGAAPCIGQAELCQRVLAKTGAGIESAATASWCLCQKTPVVQKLDHPGSAIQS